MAKNFRELWDRLPEDRRRKIEQMAQAELEKMNKHEKEWAHHVQCPICYYCVDCNDCLCEDGS